MSTSAISSLLAVAAALITTGAAAQTTTDEARAMAAKTTAAQQRAAWAHEPVAEPVAIGDYRGEAHQRERVAQWHASQRAARAYAAGVRSQPLVVNSEDSARAEAHRVHAEQALAERAATLRVTAAAK
jgi:hypothetical protein